MRIGVTHDEPDDRSESGLTTDHPLASNALVLLLALAACGGDTDARPNNAEAASADRSPAASASPAERSEISSSSAAEAPSDELLCDVIEDDEALMPAGSQTIGIPGVQEANYERRCMFDLGVDMPIDAVRDFYRSTLSDLGYEITRVVEGDGIARGNLSRTFMRATKPGLQVNLQLDEFDPSETPIAQYTVQGKVQIDAMRR